MRVQVTVEVDDAELAEWLRSVAAPLLSEIIRAVLPQEERLLTYRQAAEKIGVTEATVGNWARQGKLPREKIGRAARIPASAFVPGQSIADAQRPAPQTRPSPAPTQPPSRPSPGVPYPSRRGGRTPNTGER